MSEPRTITIRDRGGVRYLPADEAPVVTTREHTQPLVPAAASALQAMTATPESHHVTIATTYTDRAHGFTASTRPVWYVTMGATFGVVTVGWLLGPVGGWWGFLWGWYVVTVIAGLALVSLGVWLVMWRAWHRAGPDAIARATVDARLRMAERLWTLELERMYGGQQDE